MDERSTRRSDSYRRRTHSHPYRSRDDERFRDAEREYRRDDAERYPTRRRGEGRRRRRWLAPVAALALVAWFSPMLVSKTPLASLAIHNAVKDLRGNVSFDSLSLGWFSPITLYGLEIDDEHGEPVAKVARATTGKRLLSWLINRRDLGTVRIEDPQLTVIFDEKQTNFEQVLAAWLEPDKNRPRRSLLEAIEAAGITSFELAVINASVTLIDKSGERRSSLDSVQATVRMASARDGLKAQLAGSAEQDQRVSPFEASLELVPAGAGLSAQNQLVMKSESFPLWVVSAAGRRVSPGLALDGQLASSVSCTWQQNHQGLDQASVKADVTAKNLYCTAAWLKGDKLRLNEAHLPLEFTWRNHQLTISQARLDTELGQASFAGTIDTSAGWLRSLQSKPYQLNGHIDLARLATMLPNTIRVRNDTQITAGVVDLVLNADEKHDGLAWQGRLDASKLVAVSGTQTLSWEKPVHLELSAHQTSQGLAVDRLYGEADFLEMQGEGTPDGGHASASFDLDKLAGQLARFIDLSSLKLAGTGFAYFTWQREPNSEFRATAQVDAKHFELSRAGNRPWQEPQIELTADMTGAMDGAKLARVDTAEMRLTAGQDVFTARLHQPVMQFDNGGLWSVAIALRGELARWLPRAEPWLGSYAEYQLAGQCDLTADVVYSNRSFELEPLAARIQNLRLTGSDLNVNEPLVDISGTGVWSRADRQVSLSDLRWASEALVAEARDIVVLLDQKESARLRGKLTYSGDLGRLWQWTNSPQSPSSLQIAGRLTGNATVQGTPGILEATFDNTVDRFYAIAGSETWQEPRLHASAQLVHDARKKLLKLDQFQIDGQALACVASGEISDLDRDRNIRLDGKLRYDLGQLQPLWQQFTGSGVRFAGADERSFSLRGPLASLTEKKDKDGLVAVHHGLPANARGVSALEGNAEIHWTGGDLYGFPLGPGDLRGRLAQGVIHFDPIEVLASQGQLHVAPTIRLNPGPAELAVAPGRVADQIQITPEMCERALKYIAPVLAEVTEASGSFSIDLEGCQIPLANPKLGDVAGKMQLHSMTASAGPLVRELAILMNHGAPAQFTQDSLVEFRMVDGRIYHRGLVLKFPEFTLQTYGSVGLDESLAIMAELPIPPKWLAQGELMDSLRGQTIQLPIGGTLRQPKLDEKVLAETSAKFIGRAATGVLRQELKNGLERIFGPRN